LGESFSRPAAAARLRAYRPRRLLTPPLLLASALMCASGREMENEPHSRQNSFKQK
jgi:hypothetical protein